MIARMTKGGVITLEPQNPSEALALQHWSQVNRLDVPNGKDDLPEPAWRFTALEIKAKD